MRLGIHVEPEGATPRRDRCREPPSSFAPEQAATEPPDRGAGYSSVWLRLMDAEFRQGYVDALGLRTRLVKAGSTGRAAARDVARDRRALRRRSAQTFPCWPSTSNAWPSTCSDADSLTSPTALTRSRTTSSTPLQCWTSWGSNGPASSASPSAAGSSAASRWMHPSGSRGSCSTHPLACCRCRSPRPQTSTCRRKSQRQVNPSWTDIQAILEHLFYDPSSLVDDIVAVRQRIYRLPGAQSGRNLTLVRSRGATAQPADQRRVGGNRGTGSDHRPRGRAGRLSAHRAGHRRADAERDGGRNAPGQSLAAVRTTRRLQRVGPRLSVGELR